MLKIFDKSPDAAEAVTHTFLFNSPSNPRAEANAIKEILTTLIAALKAEDASVPRANGGGSASAAMAMAHTVVSKPTGSAGWYDDAQLKVDYQLQESLLKKDLSITNKMAKLTRE